MNAAKNLGIWMDHSSANILDYTNEAIEAQTIEAGATQGGEHQSSSENVMHNKENHQQAHYYKQLGDIIRNYKEVVLFGPTNAKVELYNLLKEDHHFADIKMEVMPTDKMTDHQQHAFVKEYFSKQQ